ncbi:hypothetical protein V2I01_26950 [Micromonospora sp. BRA006-A]|nr:hypothetical protein [Micromonospora sp. BRA006-A]
MPLEEFTRRWNEERGAWFARDALVPSVELAPASERALAMNICVEMGNPGGCHKWVQELYNPYIDKMAEVLPSDDLIPGGPGPWAQLRAPVVG